METILKNRTCEFIKTKNNTFLIENPDNEIAFILYIRANSKWEWFWQEIKRSFYKKILTKKIANY